jgi:hypothetical protein
MCLKDNEFIQISINGIFLNTDYLHKYYEIDNFT